MRCLLRNIAGFGLVLVEILRDRVFGRSGGERDLSRQENKREGKLGWENEVEGKEE